MHALGKVGFHMRTPTSPGATDEGDRGVRHRAGEQDRQLFRPNFFVNTPDINPFYLQAGARARSRSARCSPPRCRRWGGLLGYELFENAPLGPGREEYLDSREVPVPPARLAGRGRGAGEPRPAHRPARPGPRRAPGPAAAASTCTSTPRATADRDVLEARRGDHRRRDDDIVLVVSSVNPRDVVESDVVLDVEALGLSSPGRVPGARRADRADVALGPAGLRPPHPRRPVPRPSGRPGTGRPPRDGRVHDRRGDGPAARRRRLPDARGRHARDGARARATGRLRSTTPLPWLNDPSTRARTAPARPDDEVPRVRLAVIEVAYPDETADVERTRSARPPHRARRDRTSAGTSSTSTAPRWSTTRRRTSAAPGAAAGPAGGTKISSETGSVETSARATSSPCGEQCQFHLRRAEALTPDLAPQVFRGRQRTPR